MKDRIQRLQGNWKIMFVLAMLGFLATMMTVVGFSPLIPELQEDLGINYSQLGLFTGMTGITAMALGIPLGIFNKRFGLKRAIAMGMVFIVVGMTIIAMVSDFRVALVGRAIWTVGIQMSYIACMAAFNCIAPRNANGRALTVAYCANNLASIAGAPLGGYVAEFSSWRIAMLVLIVIVIIIWALFLMLFKIPPASCPPPSGCSGSSKDDKVSVSKRAVFSNPMVWIVGLLAFLVIFPPVNEYVPSVLKGFDYSTSQTSWAFTLSAAIGIPVLLVVGKLADATSHKRVLIALLAVMGIGTIGLAVPSSVFAFAAAVIVLTLTPAAIAIIYSIPGMMFERRDMGLAMGCIQMIGASGSYLGPQLAGVLRDTVGSFALVWVGNGMLCFLAIALMVCIGRILSRLEQRD